MVRKRDGSPRRRTRRLKPRVPEWLEPQGSLDPEELSRGLRYLTLDGVSTQVMGALTGGALLVGFALLLGASHSVIGLIAAVGPLTQLLQLPAIFLIERSRRRKALVVVCSLVGRSFWVVVALIPWLVPERHRIAMLLASLVLYFGTTAVASSAYNSWKRDLVPDASMGRFFARRLTLATAAGAAVTLASGFGIDRGREIVADPLHVFSPFFLVGALTGLLGVGFLGRIPEPRMTLARARPLRRVFAEPLRDENFRNLLVFLATWNFAINLAAPFFSVYMLVRLGLPMAWVLGLSVVSQVANVLFFKVWGRVADALGHKGVLGLSGSLFVVSIAFWPFTTLPERYVLTVPLLVLIHLLAGISTAGVNLCAGSITLKLAPKGKATAFLATNSLTSGVAATLAPALAGPLADRLAGERLSLALNWTSREGARTVLTPLDFSGLDFLFALSVLCGLYSLHRLLAVREEGARSDGAAIAFYNEFRRAVRHVSNVAGLRRLTSFPYAVLAHPDRPPRRDGPDEAGPEPRPADGQDPG